MSAKKVTVNNYKKVMLMGDSTAQLFEEEKKQFNLESNRVLVKVL